MVAPTALTCLMLAALLLAGCSGDGPAPADPVDGTQEQTVPTAETLPLAATANDRLELRDCWVIRAFLAVDYQEAQALLPDDLVAASWIEPGDRTLAMLDLLYLDCQQGLAGTQDTGPTAVLFAEIPLEVTGALSGANVFPALAVHSNDVAAAFWDGKWATQAGSLTRTPTPQGTSTLLAMAAGPLAGVLETKVPEVLSGTTDGSFRQLFDGPGGRGELLATMTGIHVALGGSAELTAVGMPVGLPNLPLTTSAGMSVANGPLKAIVFSVEPPGQ
jgi:hypothetical protein